MKHLFWIIGLLVIGSFPVFSQTVATSENAYIIQDSVQIPTRSGISISAIIVRKKTNTTPLPAILFYTTYYQNTNDAIFGKKSADRDYVGIVAYARGIKSNLKYYVPYENEGTDVYDIIDWISKQPWCDGNVGMYGGSYTGYSQWATVKNAHPALKTIVPQVAVMPGFDMPMENNVQMNSALYWSHDNIYKKEPLRRSLPFEWFEKGIAFKEMDNLAGYKNPIFQKWLSHPDYDKYWQSMVPTPEEYARISIPILSTTGYYDGAQIGALQYFKLHSKYNKNANHYFVVGPYDHWGGQRKAAKKLMGYDIDPVADVSMLELAYQWLDYILKGKSKPELLKDKINYQVMGTNTWRHAASLEKINTDTLRFYLNNKTLTSDRPKIQKSEQQTIDFTNREQQNNYYTPEIIFKNLDVSGGLLFTSLPFQQDVTINGSFFGKLSVTITKKDMDISAALYELQADGNYFFLARYVGRASYAKNPAKRQLLQPGKKALIPFENTRFVSKKINAGSRLVLLLNVNKHPFEIINYGSGKEVAAETLRDSGKPLQIEWHNDSYVSIPITKE